MGASNSKIGIPDVFDTNDLTQFPYFPRLSIFTVGSPSCMKNMKNVEKCYKCALENEEKCPHDTLDGKTFEKFKTRVLDIKYGDRSLAVLFHVTVLTVRCVQMGIIVPGAFIRLPCYTFGRDWLDWWEKAYPSKFPSRLARMLHLFFHDLKWIRGLAPKRASVIFLGLCKNKTLTMGGYPFPKQISQTIVEMVFEGWKNNIGWEKSQYPHLFEELMGIYMGIKT